MDIKGMLPTLRIGDLEINPPIIQGGMGVRVSVANLAAAVANEGCVGVIAGVGLGDFVEASRAEFIKINEMALRREIRKARQLSRGIIGVNIMVALSDYDNLVRTAAEENIDLIISGAGLPLHLPGLVGNKKTKLVPIVSSARAFGIICRKWGKNYGRRPDAVVVEGVRAGGHLGFSHEDIVNGTAPQLEELVKEVLVVARSFNPPIPVVAAGGIFDGKDIARFLKLGASGVQMASRFVTTNECDAHDSFKKAYLEAKEEDIVIIKSPVGMPGRVIRNAFVERVEKGVRIPFNCSYQCLKTCDVRTAPYCIARALDNAAKGNTAESFVFAGANAYRCKSIVSVKELISELRREAQNAL